VKIARMHKQDFGKIRAFFDLLTGDGFTIKGFKIIEGINGLFVSMPSEKNKDGEYNDTVYCVKEIREKLNQLAINHYNGSDTPIQDHTEINTKDSSDIPF
jgi:stage V sporulation protein G